MAVKSNLFILVIVSAACCSLMAVYYKNKAEQLRCSEPRLSLARITTFLQSYLPTSLWGDHPDAESNSLPCDSPTSALLYHITVHHLPADLMTCWGKFANYSLSLLGKLKDRVRTNVGEMRLQVNMTFHRVTEVSRPILRKIANFTSSGYRRMTNFSSSVLWKPVMEASRSVFLRIGELANSTCEKLTNISVLETLTEFSHTVYSGVGNFTVIAWKTFTGVVGWACSEVKYHAVVDVIPMLVACYYGMYWLILNCWPIIVVAYVSVNLSGCLKDTYRRWRNTGDFVQDAGNSLVAKDHNAGASTENGTPQHLLSGTGSLAPTEPLQPSPRSLWRLLQSCRTQNYRTSSLLAYMRKVVLLLFPVCLLISLPWEFVRLYQEQVAKRAAQLSVGAPVECRPSQMTLTDSLGAWLRSKFTWDHLDPCQLYYYNLLVDPLWEVTPVMVLSSAFVRGVVKPAEMASAGIGRSLRSLMQEVPAQWQPILLLLLLLLLILVLLTACSYRLRFPLFLHIEPRTPVKATEPAPLQVDSLRVPPHLEVWAETRAASSAREKVDKTSAKPKTQDTPVKTGRRLRSSLTCPRTER